MNLEFIDWGASSECTGRSRRPGTVQTLRKKVTRDEKYEWEFELSSRRDSRSKYAFTSLNGHPAILTTDNTAPNFDIVTKQFFDSFIVSSPGISSRNDRESVLDRSYVGPIDALRENSMPELYDSSSGRAAPPQRKEFKGRNSGFNSNRRDRFFDADFFDEVVHTVNHEVSDGDWIVVTNNAFA